MTRSDAGDPPFIFFLFSFITFFCLSFFSTWLKIDLWSQRHSVTFYARARTSVTQLVDETRLTKYPLKLWPFLLSYGRWWSIRMEILKCRNRSRCKASLLLWQLTREIKKKNIAIRIHAQLYFYLSHITWLIKRKLPTLKTKTLIQRKMYCLIKWKSKTICL